MTAYQRVAEFVRQWEARSERPNYSPTVYEVHFDPNADTARLTIGDLKALLEVTQ